MAPRADLPQANIANELDCQTDVTAHTDAKGISGAAANRPAFPIIIAEWDRNSREIVRVALDLYNGRHTINARFWYRDGDQLKPSKSGITLAVKHLPALAEAVGKALNAARELGLLKDGGEQ